MSDYDPRIDKPVFDDAAFEPRSPSRGLYLVVGVVAAVVAAAGLMFFSGDAPDRNEMARSPDPGISSRTNDTRTPTVPRVAPIPATPTEVTPAPGQQP